MSALQARGLRSRVWTIRTIAFSFLVMPSPVLAYIEGNEAELVRHGGVSNEVIHSLCNFCLCGDLRRRSGYLLERPNERPGRRLADRSRRRSEEHTSELQSHSDLVCRLLLEK